MNPQVTPSRPEASMSPLLEQLRDIHLPADPGLWPPAPGWWVLAALLIGVAIIAVVAMVRRLRHARLSRRVLDELSRIEQRGNGAELAAGVAALLKRVALARYPRRRVASLTGLAWLSFLDETGGQGGFCDGPGAVLADAPFAPDAEVDRRALIALGRRWIRSNL